MRALIVSVVLVLALSAVFYLLRTSGSGDPAQDGDKRYNLVIIVADALRRDALGCYGGEAKTPNIDALAADGVLFKNAYSTSPWTTPSAG